MNKKRTILIVDDNPINRQILAKILEQDYMALQAENGQKALSLLEKQKGHISAILLDLVMPVMDGYQFLNEQQKRPLLAGIPVIVTTQQDNEDSEIAALSHGAADFLTKPYRPEIIRCRLANLIKLRETSALVDAVERDGLTGLYNKEVFYKKASEMVQSAPKNSYDLLSMDIERFKLVNDLFGVAEGDKLLGYLGEQLSREVEKIGIAGRIGGDVFAALIPHHEKYKKEDFAPSVQRMEDYPLSISIALKFGIYTIHDPKIPLNVMCDRAKLAAQSIKGRYEVYYARYDESLRNVLLEEQQITGEMKAALEGRQFQVHYQPKYNLFTSEIVGAEALVRWEHPQKGMLTPDKFIPLFEKNGFITSLDQYVWNEACSNLKEWTSRGHAPLPISINVSRVDIYNPNLPEMLLELIQKHELKPENLHLEITETAYTENPRQLVEAVTALKKMGFVIEMDDFGKGYSSLNMLSELPIDVLKLDMRFLQNRSGDHRKINILNFIVSLAKWLGLEVVAEGIETKEQVLFLRNMNCNCGQGYYFSKPLSRTDFELLLLRHRAAEITAAEASFTEMVEIDDIWNPMSYFNRIFNTYVGALAIYEQTGANFNFLRGNDKYYQLVGENGRKMHQSSPEVLQKIHPEDREEFVARMNRAKRQNGEFVMDARWKDYEDWTSYRWIHAQYKVIYHSSDRALFFASMEDITHQKALEQALTKQSEDLREQSEFLEIVHDTVTCGIAQFSIEATPHLLNGNITMAQMLGYASVEELRARHLQCSDILHPRWREEIMENCRMVTQMKPRQITNMEFELIDRKGKPLWVHVAAQIVVIQKQRMIQVVFTDISLQKKTEQRLIETAQKDSLTGLLNRVAFEEMVNREQELHKETQSAYMMLDLDNFKAINDVYGHRRGDDVLLRAAQALKRQLRSNDLIARMGGDEFSVFMQNIPSVELAADRARAICDEIKALSGAGGEVSCSIGIALSPAHGTEFAELYQKADEALYDAKRSGKNQFCVYGQKSLSFC